MGNGISSVLIPEIAPLIAMQSAIVWSRCDPGMVMSIVAEHARHLTGANAAAVEMMKDDVIVRCAGTAGTTKLSVWCIARCRAVYARDTSHDSRVDRDACRDLGAASIVCVPVFRDDLAVGALTVVSERVDAFDGMSIWLLEMLAEVIAAAISVEHIP
jgi:hypothetical protein